MKMLSVLIKPASSLCNMRCGYCFYADISGQREIASYGIMSKDTAHGIIANLFSEFGPQDTISFAFQGGEPTLAGLEFFKDFVAFAKAQPNRPHLSWSLQTNGLLLDDAWCAFLKSNDVLVGLSLDGTAETHNALRVDAAQKGTWSRVMRAKALLERYGVEYNVLSVLTSQLARHPQQFWNFICKEKIRYVQLIPCLDELDAQITSSHALTPQGFYAFYSALFLLWKRELQSGNYISVKLFDDLVNLFIRREITACGLHGRCGRQVVVEADGGAYPCDFYVLDTYRLGNLAHTPLSALECADRAEWFIQKDEARTQPCAGCQYWQYCGGGCKRMERAMYLDKDGFCGYRAFLNDHLQELCRMGQALLRR